MARLILYTHVEVTTVPRSACFETSTDREQVEITCERRRRLVLATDRSAAVRRDRRGRDDQRFPALRYQSDEIAQVARTRLNHARYRRVVYARANQCA